MAITPTPAHYEGFVYGAVDSHTYGVVISDTNAYDSAGRAVEMITIPGRNGAYAMDHKRYENIEITYHCSIPATDPADFISAISDLRNALGALTGYNRLTDDFNDNEYRMAVLKGGVGVTNINPQAGTFDVVFDCKPQRFLTSGETAQAVTSGGTVTNPTLYPASPQLQVWGYGSIDINGETVSLDNVLIGRTVVSPGGAWPIAIDYSPANVGDDLIFMGATATLQPYALESGVSKVLTASIVSTTWNTGSGSISASVVGGSLILTYDATTMSAVYGTASKICEGLTDVDIVAESTGGTQLTGRYRFTWAARVNADGTINRWLTHQIALVSGDTIFPAGPNLVGSFYFGTIYADSTKSALGTPTIIDLDIGEAYYTSGSDVISINSAATIPAQLPVLPPGTTTITYSNTITQFKIMPRWWKL